MRRFGLAGLLAISLFALAALANGETNFDLVGPSLEVKVMRDGKTLPIAQVPSLQAGDRLWLHPDFPEEQSARYLLVVAFLRGSTNPPPDPWFVRAETWNRQVREEGIYVMVPPDAEQAVFLLAPETGGDFSTLRSNIKAKPGSFVRAMQDLNQASLDRARLDTYLAGVTQASAEQPDKLKQTTKLLGRSLNIKVDSDCFQKPASQQLTCLTADQNSLVLDDSNSQASMVAAVTSGASADLIGQLSVAPAVAAYSPYVGAVVDVVRIMDGIHTAKYQYIPALVTPDKEQVQLKLNSPPSFVNPKSVITVALPAVQAPQPPQLHLINADQIYCMRTPSMVLPVDGAPVVFATHLAHDFVLHVEGSKGRELDLPAQAEASQGGFVIDTHKVEIASLDPSLTGVLRGYWGFDPFDGPSVRLEAARPESWDLPASDKSALIVGREDTLHLEAAGAGCVDDVSVEDSAGKLLKASYKLVKPDELEVKVPLETATPGTMTLLLKQAGLAAPDKVKVQAYSEGARLDKFTFYSGDTSGSLEGLRLDEVLKLELDGVTFTPAGLKRNGNEDELSMTASGPVKVKAGAKTTAHVLLNDGRRLELATMIQPARPSVTLMSQSVDLGQTSASSAIHLANQDELPQDGTLNFVLQSPGSWPRTEKIEISTADNSLHTVLSLDDGTLTLQDSKTVLATLNPLKSLGPSAFGALRFRAVDDGVEGDWQPLGNLVRIPTLKEVHCPPTPERQCTLFGSNLFLLDSVSNSSLYRNPVQIPIGFANSSINVPRPYGTLLYFKLRDDPTATNYVSLPVMPE